MNVYLLWIQPARQIDLLKVFFLNQRTESYKYTYFIKKSSKKTEKYKKILVFVDVKNPMLFRERSGMIFWFKGAKNS